MGPLDRPYFSKNKSGGSYVIVERRNGEVKVSRRVIGVGVEVLSDTDAPIKKIAGRNNGAWQLSRSNGFVGTEKDLKKAMKLDAKLGRTINYRKTHESYNQQGQKVAAYAAEFESARHKNNWLRAHKRYDLDAGYNAPCPGDFRNNVPMEHER